MIRIRLSLALVTSSLCACTVGPLICTSGDACSQPDDHSGMYAAGLVVAAVAVIALVARAASHDDQLPSTVVIVPVPTPTARDEDIVLQRSAMQAVILARTGHCDSVLAIGRQLAWRAPSYYRDVFLANPQIAACSSRPASSEP